MDREVRNVSEHVTPSRSLITDATSARDDFNRVRLARMKWVATGLLVAMLGVFVLSLALRDEYPSLTWVHAFAEAAIVGALADWFAVTALFRHPLGLPLPHTAIIPKNKDEIGASLGQFVELNFLTPENLIRRLEQHNLALAAAQWLGTPERARQVAERLCAELAVLLDRLEDQDVRRFLDRLIVPVVQRIDLARFASEVLDVLTAEDRH